MHALWHCTSSTRKWARAAQTRTSDDQFEDDSCCWELSSAEPPNFCELEIATLCLVLAAVRKVLLTLKEKGGSYPDLTSHGKLVRGERARVRQGFYAIYDYLLTVYRISLFVSCFLPLDLHIPSNFPAEVWILSEFMSEMDFFLH